MVLLCSLFCIGLTGCDGMPELNFSFDFSSNSVRSICKQNSQLCDDLNDDGWCQQKRGSVIQDRKAELDNPTDRNKYQLLRSWQSYGSCIELAAGIQHKNNKERSSSRVKGLITTYNEINRLTRETEHSNDPFLLLFRWSEKHDTSAKRKFMAQEGQPQMNHPELLWALATIYTSSDPKKSLRLMQQSLALYKEGENRPLGHIQSITTQYMHIKDYRNAYIWSKIQENLGGGETNLAAISRFQTFTQTQIQQMDTDAEALVDKIESSQYQPN
jgi:hypothetical protein